MPVTVSPELFADVSTSSGGQLSICYQTYGDPSAEPLLLIMGLGGPMTWWNPALCELLAEAGFYVIRFDNRDVGRSTRMTGRVSAGMLVAAFVGAHVAAPYSLGDMADDAFGLLTHLGIESAHVCGISMGGMIAQTMAVAHPERVRSLTSVMSTTGQRTVGWQHPSILPAMLSTARDRESYVRNSERMWRLVGSPNFASTAEENRSRAEETWDRGVSASGTGRQTLAVLTQPNRNADLRRVAVPTTVVHGLADKMVHVSGGRTTSLSVPGSELVLIDGMGHDLPRALWPTFVRVIRRTADRARRGVAP